MKNFWWTEWFWCGCECRSFADVKGEGMLLHKRNHTKSWANWVQRWFAMIPNLDVWAPHVRRCLKLVWSLYESMTLIIFDQIVKSCMPHISKWGVGRWLWLLADLGKSFEVGLVVFCAKWTPKPLLGATGTGACLLFSTAMLALRSKQQHAILHLPLSHLSNQIKSQQCCMQGATAEDDEDAHAAAQAVG